MRMVGLCLAVSIGGLGLMGCSPAAKSSEQAHAHPHETPDHMPRSLWDLSGQIRNRLASLDAGESHPQLESELADLVSWAPEFAADTNISEEKWIPIYELSEEIRLSIKHRPDAWQTDRSDQIFRLCQVAEDAWKSLPKDKRVERYRVRHDHDHHDDGVHDHHDHDHHDGHDHEHEVKP